MMKEINGIQYIVYETGMTINDETKSYYFENDTIYEGDLMCLNLYAVKDLRVRGNQYVRGYQDVRGNQYVGGNQDVRGYQDVRGNQDVRGYQYVLYMRVYLFCKWPILLARDSDKIKIGCVEKTESEWVDFFKRKDRVNLAPTDRNYKKIECAFHAARVMRFQLQVMNDKPKS